MIFNWLASNIGWVILVFLPVLLLAFYVKKIEHREYTWNEVGVTLLVAAIMSCGSVVAGLFAEIGDTNIINGSIINKERVHGSYTTCSSTNSDGQCTSYTTHYTVDWYVHGNFGTLDNPYRESVSVGHYESTSSSSRNNRPDPVYYTQAIIGDPMSLPAFFRNYVKGAPMSLYNTELEPSYPMPAYPQVEGYYKFNRVVELGSGITTIEQLELDKILDEELKLMGPLKQVNPIVVLVGVDDSNYRYDLENVWLGGKKNDAIFTIGVDENKNITWASAFTYANSLGNEGFQINAGANMRELGTFTTEGVAEVVISTINADFTRITEKEFSYLAYEISPPWWVILIAMVLTFVVSLFIIHKLLRN